ncbi:sensor histidine kinase [Rheinheimera mangrovi]|uniref:sensor histidine kinase n=1 Tax=Rheinheimera mangrovi TaxID=2498451 RepID=UPI001E4B9BDF|nr:histidine kinase [Rheinheimera mangrovi]
MLQSLSRNQLFWLCQCGGWAVYALLTALMIKIPSQEPWQVGLPHLLLDSSFGFLLTLLLRSWYRRNSTRQVKEKILLHLPVVLLSCLVWTQWKWQTLQWLYGQPWQTMTWFDFGTWNSASLTMLLTWTALYYASKAIFETMEQRQKAAEAIHLAKEAQLKMLRYQLNPHFMFNSINSICTLILKQDNQHAVSMLEKLCDLLRYSLYTDPLAKVTVAEEIHILQTYFDVEQCRFRNKLNVSIVADDEVKNLLVPSLLLQPLAENAVKHGMKSSQQSYDISVSFSQQNGQLLIRMLDNGCGFSPQPESGTGSLSTGIGLQNCEERLALIYPNQSTLSFGNREQAGAWVQISIPKELAGGQQGE